MAANGHPPNGVSKRKYVAFTAKGEKRARIGHYDEDTQQVTPLAFKSGTPLSNLYEVIEVGESGVKATEDVINITDVRLLAPISGRDVLAVGKNYADHAKEFHSSGLV